MKLLLRLTRSIGAATLACSFKKNFGSGLLYKLFCRLLSFFYPMVVSSLYLSNLSSSDFSDDNYVPLPNFIHIGPHNIYDELVTSAKDVTLYRGLNDEDLYINIIIVIGWLYRDMDAELSLMRVKKLIPDIYIRPCQMIEIEETLRTPVVSRNSEGLEHPYLLKLQSL